MTSLTHRRVLLLCSLALVVLGIVLGVWYTLHKLTNNGADPNAPHKFTYSKLSIFKLPNQSNSTGIVFKKPVQFSQVDDLPAAKNSVEFIHNKAEGVKDVTVAYEAAAATTLSETISPSYLKALDMALTDPKDVSHNFDQQPIKDFLTSRINSRYKISLGSTKVFRSSNLTTNAWVLDFSANDSNVKNPSKPAKLTGKVVLAASHKTYYYFMIGAVDYNWQPNQQIWQQIINSLKIDQ